METLTQANTIQKTVTQINRAMQHHMVGDGFRVSNLIPGYTRGMSADTSPFLMLDYNAPWEVPVQPKGKRPGVGFHPHRGFETVTLVYSGEIEHQDTHGGGGVIRNDEVQWMTAGSGLLHNEFMSKAFSETGGIQHMVQLWVNLPKAHKMTSPRYQALTRDIIPEIAFSSGRVRVIAGAYQGVHGSALTFSPIELYDIRFDHAGKLDIPLRTGDTAFLLVSEGSAEVGGKMLQTHEMAQLSSEGNTVSIEMHGAGKVLLMAGTPLNEPVAHYGPFVMNTEQEIMQAFEDFHSGKMGVV